MQRPAILKHINRHRVLYMRIIACTLLIQWVNVIGAEDGWRTQHKTFLNNGFKISLYSVDYEKAGWKNPVYYTVVIAVGAAIVVTPFLVVWYAWASLSWASIGLAGVLGIGAIFATGGMALIPMISAASTVFLGACMMYSSLVPGALKFWKDSASMFKPTEDGIYYWPAVKQWKPNQDEWKALANTSTFMFTAGILIVLTFVFIIFRSNVKREGKDPVLGIALMVPSLLGFVGVTQYYFKARDKPPGGFLDSGADGYFDWAFYTALTLSFVSMLPILLEANYRGNFRLWEGDPQQSRSAARTHQSRKPQQSRSASRPKHHIELV